ncbi:MAG: GxxExxY protein [Planctomycetaceae bacterium]
MDTRIKQLCDVIRETSFAIHTYHRNGHTEKIYENALSHRLRKQGIDVSCKLPLQVLDEDGTVLGDLKADLLVEQLLIIEVKAVKTLLDEQYFPYHTDAYSSATPDLPSQQFGFALVRSAIERGAVFVILRSIKKWISAVPELAAYGRRFTVRNPRHVSVSPRNVPDGFEDVVRAIKNGE